MSAEVPRARHGSLHGAVSMFTIIPVRGPATITPALAARITLWLPAVGCLLAVPAAALMLAAEVGTGSALRRLLGSALAIAALAALTGGMHLDGLADTADGLGSRRTGPEALELMRRSDTGPMGVSALVLTLAVQITALAAISPRWLASAALVAAIVTSRVAVLLGSVSRAARPDGFGALIAGTTGRGSRWAAAIALVAVTGAAAAAAGGPALVVRGVVAILAGLAAAAWLRAAACRRLGGMTGDVYGALIEISAATVLVAVAVSGS
jgi:adenosylcobinamide-GDP ribazoletransferase